MGGVSGVSDTAVNYAPRAYDGHDRLASIGGVARRSMVVAGYAAMFFARTSRISSLHPTAVAYFFSVAMVGECRLSERDVPAW